MKSSLRKLFNYFSLEVSRGYDNNSVVGGLDRMLDHWAAEARSEGLDETLIEAVNSRIRDYPRLSPSSRAEALEGLWKRIERDEQVAEIVFASTDTYPDSRSTIKENLPENDQAELKPQEKETELKLDESADFESEETDEIEVNDGDVEDGDLPADRSSDRVKATDPVATEPVALDATVMVLPGIGPSHANTLARLGLNTLRDLLYYFPRRYDDYSLLKPINRLKYGDEVTVIGTVQSIGLRKMHEGRKSLVEAIIGDGTAALRITWFNQAWIARRLHKDVQIVLSGKIDQYLGRLVMNNPEWEFLEQGQLMSNRIVPVYPLTEKLTQRRIRRIMNQVIGYWSQRVRDPLPVEIRREVGLVDLKTALSQVHFPDTWDDLKAARKRLAFDEIFLLQLGVLEQKRGWQERPARKFEISDEWLSTQYENLPYELTKAQQKAVVDIRQDMQSGHPMNRLLQGDVGSGKTIVAALAIKMVVQSGSQAAMMAPTSILAEQHYKSLRELLTAGIDPFLDEFEIRLLIGATPETEKQQLRAELSEGRIKVIVGTHALLEDPVSFSDLQLAIVDEQHRFGVRQRATLRSKGENPHLLVMTATPIPRSLALTVYGDLDLSVMDEMPPGRMPVQTFVLAPRELERAHGLIKNEVEKGRQAFIVYPLVEESEKSLAKAAVDEYLILKQEVFTAHKLGLLHGRMKQDEKDEVMGQFRDGQFDILVSTTVIEVGVDIPNATVMLIEGANRFGLAQLHQLRGRVGRGAERSYCILVPDTPDAVENERLEVMVETNDGFILAERDLEQRGPGDFLGTRQSGFPDLRAANLTDVRLIEVARHQAKQLYERDPDLSDPAHQFIASALKSFWNPAEGDIS